MFGSHDADIDFGIGSDAQFAGGNGLADDGFERERVPGIPALQLISWSAVVEESR